MKKIISILICSFMLFSMYNVSFADDEVGVSNEKSETLTDSQNLTTQTNDDEISGDGAEIKNKNELENTSPEIIDSKNNDENEITVTVNGVTVVFDDVKPQILDNRTLIPMRKLGEAINAAVAWRNSDSTVHILRNGKCVVLTLNESQMLLTDYEYKDKFVYTSESTSKYIDEDTNVVARTINDRTMVPCRAICEALGGNVDWDETTKTVKVTFLDGYTVSKQDKDATYLIETLNYKPTVVIPNGTVNVKVSGNFEGAVPTLGDGVIVSIDGKTQTAANGGACVFTEMKAGTYTVTATNVPEGYKAVETTVTIKAGEDTTVNVLLEKASEADKDSTKPDNKNTDDKKDTTETKDDGSKASTDDNQSKEDTTTKTGDTSADKK